MAEEKRKIRGTSYDGTPLYYPTEEEIKKAQKEAASATPEDYIIQIASDGKEYVEGDDGLWYPFSEEDGPDCSVKGIPEAKIPQ